MFTCVTWLIHIAIRVWHESFILQGQYRCESWYSFAGVAWLIRMCTFVCVTWLVHKCNMTRSYLWHDSYVWYESDMCCSAKRVIEQGYRCIDTDELREYTWMRYEIIYEWIMRLDMNEWVLRVHLNALWVLYSHDSHSYILMSLESTFECVMRLYMNELRDYIWMSYEIIYEWVMRLYMNELWDYIWMR